MRKSVLENTKKQLRRGVLELCVLSIVSEEEAYPTDIIERLRETDMIVVQGTLYPLLTRLKNAGLLRYNWRESSTGPPRKYYYITDEGRVFLNELKITWNKIVFAVNQSTNNLNHNNEQNS